MTAALAFFFIAVFGDGSTTWAENGPYSTKASCAQQAGRYAAGWAFWGSIYSSPMPATSACYVKETP